MFPKSRAVITLKGKMENKIILICVAVTALIIGFYWYAWEKDVSISVDNNLILLTQ